MARQVRVEIIGDARRLRSAFGDAEKSSVRFGATLGRVGGVAIRAFGGVGVAAGGLAVAAAAMGIKTAAGLEQAEIAFTQLLGSGRKAQSFLGDLKRFAAATPFELPGLIDNARNLLGVGVEARKVIPILRDLGDAAGALGLDQERFNRVQLAVTQSMAKGKLQAEELMQITEAGIPVWQLLSKALDTPVPKLQKLVSQGKLAAADVFPKLFAQMHKDYGGSMAKQSQTLTGLWSTFMDTINIGLADVIKPFEGELKTGLKGAIGIAQGALKGAADFMTGTVIPGLKTLKQWWTGNKDEIGLLAKVFTGTFVPAADHAKHATEGLSSAADNLKGKFTGAAVLAAELIKWWIETRIQTTRLMSATYSLVIALGHAANGIGVVTRVGRHAGDSLIAFGEKGKQVAERDLAKLEKAAKDTQAAIDRMHGKNIQITGSLRLNFSNSFTQQDWVQVRLAAGRMAGGGRVGGNGMPGQDSQLRMLAPDEHVWTGREVVAAGGHAAMQRWRKAVLRGGIPGMAGGGPVGMIDQETGFINRVQAGGTAFRMDRGINKIMGSFAGPGGARDVNSVARWTAAILGRAAEWAAWARRIMFESGGNWSAVNRTDINWQLGHPSVGGAQVIRGTFARWAGPFRGVGPFLYGVSTNPRANSYAGGNYAIHTYGSLAAVDPRVRPIGYDHGGYLPPGLSMAWNGTGRPERVGGGDTYNFHFHGPVYGDEQALAARVRTAMRAQQRRDGVPPAQQLR